MCLGIPMRVVTKDRFRARVEARGVYRDVSLLLLQDEELELGEYVMVHAGSAIQKMSAEDAEAAWALYDELLATEGP
jgi:hydrogenase expression/formation protein HypC